MNRSQPFAFLAVALVSIACSILVGGPDLPASQPTADPYTLQALEGQVEQALSDSLITGSLSLQLTQEELTAYVASRLSTQDPPLLTDPQVVLGDQEMTLFGRATSGPFEANVAIAIAIGIDSAGLPEIRILDAQLGPMPMPQALRDAITAAIDEALTGYIGPAAIGFRLESIDISGGVMTITGRVR